MIRVITRDGSYTETGVTTGAKAFDFVKNHIHYERSWWNSLFGRKYKPFTIIFYGVKEEEVKTFHRILTALFPIFYISQRPTELEMLEELDATSDEKHYTYKYDVGLPI